MRVLSVSKSDCASELGVAPCDWYQERRVALWPDRLREGRAAGGRGCALVPAHCIAAGQILVACWAQQVFVLEFVVAMSESAQV